MAVLFYLQMASIISIEIFLIICIKGIGIFFYPRVRFLNTLFLVYKVLIDQFIF